MPILLDCYEKTVHNGASFGKIAYLCTIFTLKGGGNNKKATYFDTEYESIHN